MSVALPRSAFVSAFLLLFSQPVWSIGFSEGWQVAKRNDPTFQAALADNKAGTLYQVIGRAALLPQIALSSSRFKVTGDNTVNDKKQELDYFSGSQSVQLKQPLLDFQKTIEYQQGSIRSKMSAAVFHGKESELAIRYTGAYFNVLFARKTIDLFEARKISIAERLAQAQHLFQSGEGVVTDVDDAVTRLDLVNALQVEARQNLSNALAALREVVGQSPEQIADISDNFTPLKLAMTSLEEWVNAGLAHSSEINGRKQALELSGKEVQRARAQHLPTIDFVGSYSKSTSGSVSKINERERTRQIGIQVNIPLFSGGGINAQVEQAAANNEKTAAELDAATIQIRNEIEKQYYAQISGANRIVVLEKALRSAERSVNSNVMSFKGGVRTNLDVLNAQEQMFQIKKDLLEAKLSYMTSIIKLYATAGLLTDTQFNEMNVLFDRVVTFSGK